MEWEAPIDVPRLNAKAESPDGPRILSPCAALGDIKVMLAGHSNASSVIRALVADDAGGGPSRWRGAMALAA